MCVCVYVCVCVSLIGSCACVSVFSSVVVKPKTMKEATRMKVKTQYKAIQNRTKKHTKNHAKFNRKSTKNPPKIHQKCTKKGPKYGSEAPPVSSSSWRGSRAAPWRFLGRSWAALGAPGGPLGARNFFFTPSWAPLGAVLALSWTPWVALRTLLGTPSTPPGASWGLKWPHRTHQDPI